ncbi:uncharacterized protein M6B38_331525 [Iris pallida]|uniref:Uncharacterized protein n=1 Tax=Iris pallida TaxID=29817 RepID=A0AAX6H4P6_IRIPA|nr:uncharacterized protein M6B38_357170 [Iris pallida]KAJ6835608.1 uncharacterized protein M6B38_331525 [Iris pallida]
MIKCLHELSVQAHLQPASTMHHRLMSPIASHFCSRSLKPISAKHGHVRSYAAFYHPSQDSDDECLPSEWYGIAYAKLIRLTHVLKNVQHRDGRLVDIDIGSTITDDCTISKFRTFNSVAKAFIRSPSSGFFNTPNERRAIKLDSLTKVCNFLNISAQQRKNVRLAICPQVTQHHIWRGALEKILIDLKLDMDASKCSSRFFQIGEQILSSCTNFFAETAGVTSSDSPSWMRPAPLNKVEKPLPSREWEEVLEMFVDLSRCLEGEERLAPHVAKLEVMKEGLSQIKDIVVERDISYKEVRRQDCLVQRKLSKSLGHSSKCLFTLLLYYLYGTTRDIEVDLCGAVHGSKNKFCLCIGEIVTSCDEEMLLDGIKKMNRALGLFKFVWESAGMNGVLELQGHVWCMGTKERILTYRGNKFFVHSIRLP